MYFHLFSVKRLDLFLLHPVTLPELGVQHQFYKYLSQKKINGGLDICLYLVAIFP
jgi:hypothetical protein